MNNILQYIVETICDTFFWATLISIVFWWLKYVIDWLFLKNPNS